MRNACLTVRIAALYLFPVAAKHCIISIGIISIKTSSVVPITPLSLPFAGSTLASAASDMLLLPRRTQSWDLVLTVPLSSPLSRSVLDVGIIKYDLMHNVGLA
jgi:hypothetical protein